MKNIEWRRFQIINKEQQNDFEELLKLKNISREDLILILSTIKIKESEYQSNSHIC